MKNASWAEGREHDEHAKAEPLFPSDGRFNAVVPLSQLDDATAPSREALAPEEPEEETTLVPARRNRATRPTHTPRAKRGVEQSWPFLAAVLTLSVVAGLAAGAYMIRSLRPSETHSAGPPAAGIASESADKAIVTQPAAEPPTAPTSGPSPQTEQNRLAAAPVATEAPAKPDANVESRGAPPRPRKSSPQADEMAADRNQETKPRTRARAAEEAQPAPRLARTAAAPRRAERPARAAATPERNLPISTPPPSAKPRKVIQWP